MTAPHAPTRSARRHRPESRRAAALAIALLTALAPAPAGAGLAAEEPAADPAPPSPAEASAANARDAGRGRSRIIGGVGMMAGSAALGALAVWQWAAPRAYADFMLGLSDDPGPLIDPTLFFTPGYSIALASLGGATVLRGVAMRRGAEPKVSWTYWLPLAPGAIALGTEVYLLLIHGQPSRAGGRLIAAGTATSVLCFWGSTAVHASRLRTEVAPEGAAAPAATRIIPLLAYGAGGPTVGLSMRGVF